MAELKHIEDAIIRLVEVLEQMDETQAYHAGLAIKIELLKFDAQYDLLTVEERQPLVQLIKDEVLP